MKNTQGTWEINRDNDGDVNAVITNYHGAICSFPKYYGAKPTISGIEELEANARLIAAAPELLRALKACARHLNTNNEIDRVLYEIAIEAIKKATQDS